MKKNDIKNLQNYLEEIFKIQESVNVNVLHNYKWRELIQLNTMEEVGVKVSETKGVAGVDFSSKLYVKGELKSGKGRRLKNGSLSRSAFKWEFDKQNDEIRRKQTQNYDCLFFSCFIKATPIVSVLINSKKSLKSYVEKVKKKQKAFMKLMEDCSKKNKRVPRDSISFNYKDAIELDDARYFHKSEEITLESFKKLFGDKV